MILLRRRCQNQFQYGGGSSSVTVGILFALVFFLARMEQVSSFPVGGRGTSSYSTRLSPLLRYYDYNSQCSLSTALGSSSEGSSTTEQQAEKKQPPQKKKDNSAMRFLKKIGRVGRNQDFTHAIGVDEGSEGESSHSAGGGAALRKTTAAYPRIGKDPKYDGIVDALTEPFPLTSLGTSWSGYTDQVMGGQSMGLLERQQNFHGKTCNVLRGSVRNLPGRPDAFGFVQMATNLLPANPSTNSPLDTTPAQQYADASSFDGVQLQVLYQGNTPSEQFNVHLKTPACRAAPQSSYRGTFTIPEPNTWHTVQIPWSNFSGKGPGANTTPFDPSQLTRIGIVAIGKEMPSLVLAVSRLAFYHKNTTTTKS